MISYDVLCSTWLEFSQKSVYRRMIGHSVVVLGHIYTRYIKCFSIAVIQLTAFAARAGTVKSELMYTPLCTSCARHVHYA